MRLSLWDSPAIYSWKKEGFDVKGVNVFFTKVMWFLHKKRITLSPLYYYGGHKFHEWPLSYLKYVKSSHISIFSSFTTTTTASTTFLLFSLHQHICLVFFPSIHCLQYCHHHISIGFPPPLPSQQGKEWRKGLAAHTMTTHTSTYRHVCLLCRRMNCNCQGNRTSST